MLIDIILLLPLLLLLNLRLNLRPIRNQHRQILLVDLRKGRHVPLRGLLCLVHVSLRIASRLLLFGYALLLFLLVEVFVEVEFGLPLL